MESGVNGILGFNEGNHRIALSYCEPGLEFFRSTDGGKGRFIIGATLGVLVETESTHR